MKYIIIFPNKNQLKIIDKYEENIKNNILVVPNKVSPKNEETIFERGKIKNEKDIKVLCCHEEGIYWLKNNVEPNMQLAFDKECFGMTNKWSTYEIFKQRDIPCVYKTNNIEKIKKYPIVAKPNIGFGSIGVKKIDNSEELKEYLEQFDTMMEESVVAEDKEKFFKSERNFPVFEECIENGQFFSVPFVVDENKEIKIYPVMGTRKENTAVSNYKWATFLYRKNTLDEIMLEKIKKVVSQIANQWIKDASVNLVEMIYDNEEKDFKVLEFSPRVVGGRIAKMIEYALGINLDEISMDLFFKGNEICIKEKYNKTTIVDICNVGSDGNEVTSYEAEKLVDYKLVEVEETKSPIGANKIRYKIFEKESE